MGSGKTRFWQVATNFYKINSMIYYDKPLYKQPFYKKKIKLLKNTEYVCKHCISLPIHPSLNKNQIIKICEKIKFFYKKL